MEGKTLEPSPEFNPVVVPDGIYKAKVKEYRTNTHPQFGVSLIIDFEFMEGPQKGKVIGGFASWEKITKKTKLYRWAANLGAPIPTEVGQVFNPDALIGKEGRILTSQVQKNDRQGKPFWQSQVKDVLGPEVPASTQTPQSPQPVLPPAVPAIPVPVPTPVPKSPQNKMDILRKFEGKDFTEQDLINIGFSEKEIDSLTTMGYVYKPTPISMRLVTG